MADQRNGAHLMPCAVQQILIATNTGSSGSGTARQVAIYSPARGLMLLNSGSTSRQTSLPAENTTEGR